MKSAWVTKLCQNGMNFLNDGGRDIGNPIYTVMIDQLRRLLQSITVQTLPILQKNLELAQVN
jgi:hypothetical protein